MGVEDGAQADHGEEERGPHDDRVRQLQLLLALVPEDAVQEHACIRREKEGRMSDHTWKVSST